MDQSENPSSQYSLWIHTKYSQPSVYRELAVHMHLLQKILLAVLENFDFS
jgi:hypothetical protein